MGSRPSMAVNAGPSTDEAHAGEGAAASGPQDRQEPTMEEILASIRRIISEDGETAADPEDDDVLVLRDLATEPDAGGDPGEEVFELTELLEDAAEPEPPAPDATVAEEAPEPSGPLPPAAPAPADEGPVSREAVEQTAAALAGFASAVSSARGVRLGAVDRTLEDLVEDLLRPMLKEWLDENLQPIVSRAVEREIAKLAERVDRD